MKLEPLTQSQCEQVRLWRNAEMECWRTPFMLTEDMQYDFYERCSDRNSPHRYFAIMGNGYKFIGMGGITYIQWENRIGEITLIIDPQVRKDGLGEQAVDLLLDQAFNHLNLNAVFGECYCCNPAFEFWKRYVDVYASGAATTTWVYLPVRKYWNGQYWSSLYFNVCKNDFNKNNNRIEPACKS